MTFEEVSAETVTTVTPELIAHEIVSIEPMEMPSYSSFSFTYSGDDEMRNMGNFTISVAKADLLESLRANLKKHKDEFGESFRGFKNLCIKELRKRATKIKMGKADDPRTWLTFGLTPPRSHERDYEQLIGMLEMAQNDEFEITGAQFRQWVQDEWDWKVEHVTSNALYSRYS